MSALETNELAISSATGLLSVVLALLAILPIVFDLVSARVKAYFQAGRVRSQINAIFAVLVITAVLLTLSLLVSFLAILKPALLTVAAYGGIVALIISLIGLIIAVVLGGTILKTLLSTKDG